MEKTYTSLCGVLTSDFGQDELSVIKGRQLFVEAGGRYSKTPGNYSEEQVTELEAKGQAIVLVEGIAGDRKHLKPRGDNRWLMFGGTFAYTSDSRFPYEYPIHIHDRYEGKN